MTSPSPWLVGQAARPGKTLRRAGLDGNRQRRKHGTPVLPLVQEILGFPRHLSQHVGGFVISRGPISSWCRWRTPHGRRTVIQWDKEDIEALGLLKVDVLALGMLSGDPQVPGPGQPLRAAHQLACRTSPEDAATYRMLQQADSIGVFQIESRAQMTMLPRLNPPASTTW
jgi:error-prone DNA polymerase